MKWILARYAYVAGSYSMIFIKFLGVDDVSTKLLKTCVFVDKLS